MTDWYLGTQIALMDLLYWLLVAVFVFGVVGIVLDVLQGRRRDRSR